MAPNCAELITATLAAQLAGIAAPLNGGCPGGTSPSCSAAPAPGCSSPPGPSSHRPCGDSRRAAATRARRDPGRCGPPPRTARRPSRCPPSTACASATSTSSPRARGPAALRRRAALLADLAALFHTGGTTGAPKLAAHTHANEVADAWMLAADPCSTPTRRCSPRCRCSMSTRSSSPCSRRCSRGSPWCGPVRSATATPRCSASSGRSSSTTGSPR